MKLHPEGREVLAMRPVVNDESVRLEQLQTLPGNTFGFAYAQFMSTHAYSASERPHVRCVLHCLNLFVVMFVSRHLDLEDDELAFVLLRYRQVHDFWHTLTELPVSVLGELGLKWLEVVLRLPSFSSRQAVHTRLPVASLSAAVGPLRLNHRDRQILYGKLVPWAWSCRHSADLLSIFYERHFEEDIDAFRRKLGLTKSPLLDL